MEIRKDSILEIFKRLGALLEGHFLLSSGLHSDRYIQCALVFQYPDIAEKIAILLFEEIRNNFNRWEEINLIVSPALGGIIIGQEIARVLKTFTVKKIRAIFTERDSNGKMSLRRNFDIKSDDKVLIVEDVLTTGKSTNEVIEVVREKNAEILALASVVNRASEDLKLGYPYFYLVGIKINNYQPQECPLCKKGIELVKPGSRKIF
ncbi:MAG: orotate phosphoribosyltransferase [Endomicrobiia bacterium]